MSKFDEGDKVIAIKDFGGWARESVDKGTKGVVVDAGGWLGRAKVLFHKEGFWSDKDFIEEVDDDEVARVNR